MQYNKLCLKLGLAVWLALNLSLPAVPDQGAVAPLPEFFGVYVIHDGKLVELKAIEQNSTALDGADLIRVLPGTSFPSGDLYFVLFLSQLPDLGRIPVVRVARVDNEIDLAHRPTPTCKRWLGPGYWHAAGEGIQLRAAPLPENPATMFRLVPEGPLSSGLWALKIGEDLYAFGIGSNPEAQADCVDRYRTLTGAAYKPCQAEVARNLSINPQGRGAASIRMAKPDERSTAALANCYSAMAIVPPGKASMEEVKQVVSKAILGAGYAPAYAERGVHNVIKAFSLGSHAWIVDIIESAEVGVVMTITRGSASKDIPQDIPKLLKFVAAQLAIDPTAMQLTIGAETKALSAWN